MGASRGPASSCSMGMDPNENRDPDVPRQAEVLDERPQRDHCHPRPHQDQLRRGPDGNEGQTGINSINTLLGDGSEKLNS
jgi:hypothetical protein